MENKRIYIVSFSDSRQYIIREDADAEKSRLVEIENMLNNFLSKKFPEDSFAYYTTPKVVEINEELASTEYSGYPELDDKAVEEIKKELEIEIKDMRSNARLDSDAPFADVDPEAAGFPAGVDKLM